MAGASARLSEQKGAQVTGGRIQKGGLYKVRGRDDSLDELGAPGDGTQKKTEKGAREMQTAFNEWESH